MSEASNKGDELDRLRSRCDDLESLVEKLEFERAGYYGEWQETRNRLTAVKRSPAWPVWLLWVLVWRILLGPVRLGFELLWKAIAWLARAVARPRFVGPLWLLITMPIRRLQARLRRPPATIPAPKPPAGGCQKILGRRPRVLIVSPYSIYPPNHGGAVRLFNLVRELADACELYLLIFNQGGEDPEQRAALEAHCARVDFHHWRPQARPDRFGFTPPNAQLFASERAAAKLADIVRGHGIDIVQLEYTELGQYHASVPDSVPVILTEHDIAFRSFGRRRSLGFQRRFTEGRAFGSSATDWRRLLRHEVEVCSRADQIHTMSEDDGRFLARHLADGADRMRVAPNGVASDFYRPPAATGDRRDVLYVGNFQNLPNVDALEFLAIDVWPLLRLRCPDARLTVVGANPSERVLRFDGADGITVVGAVDDLRPYYHGHRLMVAPIRAGSGTRLKILEAFAAGLPVVTTTVGAEGIAYENDTHLVIADSAVALADAMERVLSDDDLIVRLAGSGRELVAQSYDWRLVAERLYDCYGELLASADRRPSVTPAEAITSGQPSETKSDSPPEVSVVIPTLHGGDELARSLAAIAGQQTARSFEILCIDSGSDDDDLKTMHRHGARVFGIDRRHFNHGLTRDLGAGLARGDILVFLNQDAIPCDEAWLDRLTEALWDGDDEIAAVQGGIRELPEPDSRFYWDSCGDRFYFTSESDRWIEAHDGIGFSTVNCAIRRSVWQRYPFGWAPIMEDKKWQREVVEAGYELVARPDAAAFHTHNYDLRALLRRCRSEGYGWRKLGEHYGFFEMVGDMLQPRMYRELAAGVLRGRARTPAELLFPWLRPLVLYWGNHLSRDVAL